jgi:hypothetical protein
VCSDIKESCIYDFPTQKSALLGAFRILFQLFRSGPLPTALLLDSEVLCSHVVQEAQVIFKALENKGFKEESMTKVELYAIGTSTPLESNKSHC